MPVTQTLDGIFIHPANIRIYESSFGGLQVACRATMLWASIRQVVLTWIPESVTNKYLYLYNAKANR